MATCTICDGRIGPKSSEGTCRPCIDIEIRDIMAEYEQIYKDYEIAILHHTLRTRYLPNYTEDTPIMKLPS